MTEKHNLLPRDVPAEPWNEELARAKKYNDATQKRQTEKLLKKLTETLKKASQAGDRIAG